MMKSERSAKLMMAKLLKAYKAAERACNQHFSTRLETTEEEFEAKDHELEATRRALYGQMLDLRDAAQERGCYVSNDTIRYNESATRELVANNMD